MEQPIIEVPPPQPKPEIKPVEGIRGKVREWTKKGKDWLARLKGKVDEEPKEVIEEVAAAPQKAEELISAVKTPTDDKTEQQEAAEVRTNLQLPAIEEFPESVKPLVLEEQQRLRSIETTIVAHIGQYEQLTSQDPAGRAIIEKMVQLIEEDPLHTVIHPEFLTSEMVQTMKQINIRLKAFGKGKESLIKSIEVGPFIGVDTRLDFDTHISSGEEAARRNELFATSQALLTHATPIDTMRTILTKGSLASKKYQLDHYGECYYHTAGEGGIKVTREGKIYKKDREGKYSVEIPEGEAYRLKKVIGSEDFDLDFSEDGFHDYFDLEESGVALVFSERSIYSRNQFGSAAGEGVAVFDSSYDPANPNSEGAHIDLALEPFLLVVDDRKQEEIIRFVREDLVRSETWREKITDIDRWIEQHILVKPDGMEAEQLTQVVRDKLFSSFQIPDTRGHFIPADRYGERRTYHAT